MDYEKAYNEAIKRAKAIIEVAEKEEEVYKSAITIFPELYESEDERIRKSLIKHFREYESCTFDGLTSTKVLAWLEKQGEHKLTDKIEPKFHEGEWITNGDYTWKIVEVKPLDYILQSQEGNIVDDTISHVDEQFHSFTIKDAKDGDVLIDKSGSRECPFIFKEIKPSDIKTDILNPLAVLGYCGIGGAGFTKGSGWGDTANCIYYPATKEQRDLLFQKMKEAGYEWDSNQKELKKINWNDHIKYDPNAPSIIQESDWSDVDEADLNNIIWLCNNCINGSETTWIPSQATRIKSPIERIKNTVFLQSKQEWNEEDDKIIEEIINDIECARAINYHAQKEGYEFRENWLKSIKDKIQLQPKQEWSEEDETGWTNTMIMIKEVASNHYTKDSIKLVIDWLKSLKERYTWKPSEEQIDTLEHFVRSIGESDYASPYGNNTKLLYSLLEQLKKLKA